MNNKCSHKFVDEFDGFVGFGLNRKSDEDTFVYYLQKFSNDQLMEIMRKRLSDCDLKEVFDVISGLLKKYLTESEYHRLFLR